MAEKNESSGGELPKYRFAEKKVDNSWKEEVRKEREATQAKAGQEAQGAPPGGAPSRTPPSGAPDRTFLNFIAGLIQQTLMQLGRVENPFSGRREVDLEGARQSIDLLNVLKEKTQGNLAEQEARALSDSTRELQFHYVETAKEVERQMKAQPEKPGPSAAS